MRYSGFFFLAFVICAVLFMHFYKKATPPLQPGAPAPAAPISPTAAATQTQVLWSKAEWFDDLVSNWDPTRLNNDDRNSLCRRYGINGSEVLCRAAAKIHGKPEWTDFSDLSEEDRSKALDQAILEKMAVDCCAREQKLASAGVTGNLQDAVFAQIQGEGDAALAAARTKKQQAVEEYRDNLRGIQKPAADAKTLRRYADGYFPISQLRQKVQWVDDKVKQVNWLLAGLQPGIDPSNLKRELADYITQQTTAQAAYDGAVDKFMQENQGKSEAQLGAILRGELNKELPAIKSQQDAHRQRHQMDWSDK